MTETERVEVLHVILEAICVLITQIFCQIHVVFFLIPIPKVKPIALGIFYRPPNAEDFWKTFSNDLLQIYNKIKEIYLLRHFTINVLQNGKLILKENQSFELKNRISA